MPWNGGWGFTLPSGGDVKFCGRACFHAWKADMTFSNTVIEAIDKMLPAMGAYVAQAGIASKPFAECSRDEILALFANTIKTFRVTFQDVLGDDVPF